MHLPRIASQIQKGNANYISIFCIYRYRLSPRNHPMDSGDEIAEEGDEMIVSFFEGVETIPLRLLLRGINLFTTVRDERDVVPDKAVIDDLVSELYWELLDDLPDGQRLTLPGFGQARRNQGRTVQAAYSATREAERHLTYARRD